jgi:hypothetical protein
VDRGTSGILDLSSIRQGVEVFSLPSRGLHRKFGTVQHHQATLKPFPAVDAVLRRLGKPNVASYLSGISVPPYFSSLLPIVLPVVLPIAISFRGKPTPS